MRLQANFCRLLGALCFCLFFSSAVVSAEQTPWQSHGTTDVIYDLSWPGQSLGYKFTPQVHGQITKLGGLFNGTFVVQLYETSTATLLAQTSITAANSWVFVPIAPVIVHANTQYTVAIAESGSGISMNTGANFPILPVTYGDIQIDQSVWGFVGTMPNTDQPGAIYGQPDIAFEPISNSGINSIVTSGVLPNVVEIDLANMSPQTFLEAHLIIENTSSNTLLYNFGTTQRFDIQLKNSAGQKIYTWSNGRTFDAVAGQISIPPGGSETVGTEVFLDLSVAPPLPEGNYTILMFLKSSPAEGTAHLPGTLPPVVAGNFKVVWIN